MSKTAPDFSKNYLWNNSSLPLIIIFWLDKHFNSCIIKVDNLIKAWFFNNFTGYGPKEDILKRLFILLVFVLVSFLTWNESAFPINEGPEIGVLRVKIFDFKKGNKADIEREINSFLSNNKVKIEQIIQTSAGAGGSGYIEFWTIITIFYR